MTTMMTITMTTTLTDDEIWLSHSDIPNATASAATSAGARAPKSTKATQPANKTKTTNKRKFKTTTNRR